MQPHASVSADRNDLGVDCMLASVEWTADGHLSVKAHVRFRSSECWGLADNDGSSGQPRKNRNDLGIPAEAQEIQSFLALCMLGRKRLCMQDR